MRRYVNILFAFFCVCVLNAQTDYETDVLPIFEVKCAGCHAFNGGAISSGLNLTTEEDVLSGATSGTVIVSGDYLNSVLYQRVIGEGGYMPPTWSSNEILSTEEVGVVVSWIEGLDDGCTDPDACNYDPLAIDDNGTCEYDSCAGCTDDTACNYGGSSITIDDGSCDFSCIGCDDPVACNYGGLSVTINDGSCEYEDPGLCLLCIDGVIVFDDDDGDGVCNNDEVLGCTDSEACTYNELATEDDGSCEYLDICGVCGGDDTLCYGCVDDTACNYGGPSITEDDGSCEYESCAGCTDEFACDFDPTATISSDCDYSCIGCLDEAACNYCVDCIIEDNDICEYQSCLGGCTDVLACNYNPNILIDDGSCVYLDGVCETCENGIIIDNDSDDDGVCDFDETVGCTDIIACNYDTLATDDDGTCIYVNSSSLCDECSGETDGTGVIVDNDSDNDGLCNDEDPCPDDPDNDTNNNGVPDCDEIVGCTDGLACNYNESANTDDGSCVYAAGCDYCSGEQDGSGLVVDGDIDNDNICDIDEISGCTNPNACNYCEECTDDDGSCESLSCVGCTDPLACNYCPDCTISIPATCDYDTCCDDFDATNYDPNCVCVDNSTCFNVPDGCDFSCFSSGEGIYPIPITSSYGAYEISCFGASDGSLSIDFNTMNLVSAGAAPYSIQVYQQVDLNNDGVISVDEEILIGTLTEDSPGFNNLTAGDYVLIAYDVNGCCGQTLISMDQPGENTLTISDYDPILCPDGETQIDFVIDGSVGQFDATITDLDGDIISYNESIDGGTVTVSSFDGDLDGVPDDFIQLNTIFYFNENFWPPLYNECEGFSNTIYINIENDEDIETGDLIGAFYTTGDGTLQSFAYNTYTSSSSGSSFFTMQICEGDENGFNNGEEVIFLVYDISDDLIYEVDVVYEYNNASGTFSDVFTTDSSYDGIWISSLSIIGVSGSVPDFSLIAVEGSYNIQVNRTDSIDSSGDGVLDDIFICSVVDTIINVVDPDPMSVDVSIGGSVCNYLDENNILQSTPGGFIELDNFIGGTPPYLYSWEDQDGNQISQSFISGIATLEDFDNDGVLDDLDFLNAGFYTLSVEDFNGCEFTLDVELDGSDIQLNQVDVDYTLIACSGGSTSVNVELIGFDEQESYLFEWVSSNGDVLLTDTNFSGFIQIDNVEEGSYSSVITDSFGCSIVASDYISVDDAGVIFIYDPVIDQVCDGVDAYVSFSDCPTADGSCVGNGTGPFSYNWYLMEDLDADGIFETSTSLGYPSTTSEATLEFGTYLFSVTDSNGCYGETMFTLSAPDPISFTPTIDPIVCDGDFASISLEILEGNPGLYDFIFEGDTTTITIGGDSALDFGFSVSDANATLLFNDVSIFTPNDVIGVFYTGDSGITCGGSFVYQGESVFSVAVWGDDSSTPADDGFETGENILILLNSGGLVYELNIISYDTNPALNSPFTYAANGLSAITAIELGDEFSQGPNFVIDSLLEGDYYIQVVDGNQCQWDTLIPITGVPAYGFNSSVLNPSCDGDAFGEINIDVFGGTPSENGYTFIWTSPDVVGFTNIDFGFSNTLTDLSPGSYVLTVVDANGCEEVGVFDVDVYTSEPFVSVSDELCGDDGSISVCVDWVGDVTFSYSSSQSNETVVVLSSNENACYTFENLASSMYDLTITSSDNSCVYLQNDVFVDAAEPISVEFVTEAAECEGGTGSVWITLLEGGNPPYEIDWQGISTEFAPVGFHQFTITDANGCQYLQNYGIQNATAITVDFDVENNDCFGGEDGVLNFDISGGDAGGYNYSLYNSNSLNESLLDGFGSSGTLSGLLSGFYTLIVEDASGCVVSFSEQIFNLSNEIEFDDIEIDDALCYGENGSVSLNIVNALNSDYIYHWYQLDGPDWDVDGDGILNSEDFSIDGGEFISSEVGFSDQVFLESSNYFVFVESILNSCFSDTVLFNVGTSSFFGINMDDVYVSCYGDVASAFPIVYGGGDDDIDGDGLVNNDEFGNWVDPDIDGDGIYDIDGDCLFNCNDDDDDIDNDGVDNNGPDGIPGNSDDDTYIGGTIYNGLSTNSSPLFSNGLVFENESGDEVDPYALTAGEYTVYSYDSNGCIALEQFSVIQPPLFDVSIAYDYNAEGFIESLDGPIEILCYGDSVAIVAAPFGGTPPYTITCLNAWSVEVDLAAVMLSSGDYTVLVSDSQGCEISSAFSILNEPNELIIDADEDNDGVDGVLQYNNFHISCHGESDGVIEYFVPQNAGTAPYDVDVFYNNNLLNSNAGVFSNQVQVLDQLNGGLYDFIITDSNGCVLQDVVELIEPAEFSPEIEYIINASCDEQNDGMIIIRTSGGNPPFNYVVDGSSEILTTNDTLLWVYEDMGSSLVQDVDPYMEEILITDSDIVVSGLNGNSWHTITILNDEYSCLDDVGPVGYSLYVGSNDDNCLFIPSVFTPNGDGINDTWQIDGMDLYPNPQIRVFNRWGQVVFESSNQQYVPWDGTSDADGADQEIATYYYVIDLNLDNKNYNGSVTIKR
ncbi:MAG: hypothetical protein CMD23_00665 [Flavobacteriales bacterium]|nr:hypothetical protein [Flavobacteriales bacterium]